MSTAAVVPSAVLSFSLPAVLHMNCSEGNSGRESEVTLKFPEIIKKTRSMQVGVCVCKCALCVLVFFFKQSGTDYWNSEWKQALQLMEKGHKDMPQSG